MTAAAIVLALASASCFGLALTLTQFGLRDATPSAGAAISIPTSTLLFVLAAPVGLAGSSPQWAAVPVFACVGLLFPAAVTLITFEANRRLGPVVAGSLGNLAPVFAVLLAFLLLGEPLRVALRSPDQGDGRSASQGGREPGGHQRGEVVEIARRR